jgi:hypothetical protein
VFNNVTQFPQTAEKKEAPDGHLADMHSQVEFVVWLDPKPLTQEKKLLPVYYLKFISSSKSYSNVKTD